MLDPKVMAQYEKNYADHRTAFDHFSGDLQRERSELAMTLRQMENGTPGVHLPPDVQHWLVGYCCAHSDTLRQHAA